MTEPLLALLIAFSSTACSGSDPAPSIDPDSAVAEGDAGLGAADDSGRTDTSDISLADSGGDTTLAPDTGDRYGELNSNININRDFLALDEDFALSVSPAVQAEGETLNTFNSLYDTRKPVDVRLSDLIEYRNTHVHGAIFGGRPIVVEDSPYGVNVVILEVEDGKLVEVARTDDIFDGTDAEYADKGIDDLLSNDDRLVLVTETAFVEFDVTPPDGPQILRHVDRRDDYVEHPYWWRPKHVLTADDHVLELGDGVSVWTLDPAPGESPLVGRLEDETIDPSLWAYDPTRERIFLCSRHPSPDEDPAAGYSEVIDVSDRAQPAVVAKWNPDTDFGLDPGEQVDNCWMTVAGDRLYVVQDDLDAGSSLIVLDLTGDIETPTVLNRIRPTELISPDELAIGQFRGAKAIGDRLYIAVDGFDLKQPPRAPLVVVDLATLEP